MTTSLIEKAFELARSGEFKTVHDIVQRLYRENYDQVAQHLGGRATSRQLKAVIASGRSVDTAAQT